MVIPGILVVLGLLLTAALVFAPTIAARRYSQINKQSLKAIALNAAAVAVYLFAPLIAAILWVWAWFAALRGTGTRGVKILRAALMLFVMVSLLNAFVVKPFSIAGGGNKPTLLAGDYVWVSKYTYGYSHYSFPFSPDFFSGRVFGAEPQRGDFVIFREPKSPDFSYVLRVIGLPGDRVQMTKDRLFINDRPMPQRLIGKFVSPDGGSSVGDRYLETLPNGTTHDILIIRADSFAGTTQVYTVPVGHYFLMGDNRDNVTDSRYTRIGFVPAENLEGKVQMIFFSVHEGENAWEFWRWPVSVRWNRLFTLVQ